MKLEPHYSKRLENKVTTLGLTLNDLLIVLLLVMLAGTIGLVWSISSVRKFRKIYPVTARVAAIYKGVNSDVFFRLENDAAHYYVDKGLRRGLSLTNLQRTLLGETITLDARKLRWNPLDPSGLSVPIDRIRLADEELFPKA